MNTSSRVIIHTRKYLTAFLKGVTLKEKNLLPSEKVSYIARNFFFTGVVSPLKGGINFNCSPLEVYPFILIYNDDLTFNMLQNITINLLHFQHLTESLTSFSTSFRKVFLSCFTQSHVNSY